MTEDTTIKPKKILIMGLDNSGKTSIVLSLMGVKNLSSFSLLNPTRGIMITKFYALGSEYTIWDFGGQQQFREGYFKDFHAHIKGTRKFIYVLDIQDQNRYDISLEYLQKIIVLLKKHYMIFDFDFSIFLHKYDPDSEFNDSKISESAILGVIKKIKEKIPEDFEYQIYKTSIYTVFQKLSI
jgi:GTPase SAR1 family protein